MNISFRRRPGNIEVEILRTLRAGPLSSTQLSQRLGRTRQHVFSTLQKLSVDDLVEMQPMRENDRSIYWSLKTVNTTSDVKPE